MCLRILLVEDQALIRLTVAEFLKAEGGEGMQSTFGYGPDQVGESTRWCHEHMHPDDRERVVRGMAAAIDSCALYWEDRFRYRKADGSYLEVLDRGSVIRDAQGNLFRRRDA